MNTLLNMLEHANRDHPVTREEIRRVFRCGDRAGRNKIEQLRDQGYPVIGTSDEKGYWLAGSKAELEAFLRNYTAKARTIEKRAGRMRHCFPVFETGQEVMDYDRLYCCNSGRSGKDAANQPAEDIGAYQ